MVELPYRGDGPPVSLLLLISSLGGNIPTRHLLDDRVFRTFVVTPEFFDSNAPLPLHQVVFNAIGDADLAASSLDAAESLLARTPAPVINRPAAVLSTGRAAHSRLSNLDGVIAPLTVTLPREVLLSSDAAPVLARHGFVFPLLVRSPGFHTGRHFLRVENFESLAGAVAELPGKEIMVIEFLDARSAAGNVDARSAAGNVDARGAAGNVDARGAAGNVDARGAAGNVDARRADGKARKYRVMMIDGQLYPLHVAISSDWKIHYFTAEMAENAAHRAEDAEFLENMAAVLGVRAMEALTRIQAVLDLDYAGIDFGLSANGDILLFEANATMVVNPPEPDQRWAYRRPAVDRIFAAVRKMILSR